MKLKAPDIEVPSDEGFSSRLDIFGCKAFGDRLANLLTNTENSPVFALDANWGEGKTTFIKMWMGHVENHRQPKLKTIYFDAFENDYQKDPFLALASSIYSLIPDSDEAKKAEFWNQAGNVAKSLARGLIKIGVRAATGGVVSDLPGEEIEKEFSDLLADEVDALVKDKLKHVEQDRLALDSFKKYLTDLSKELGDGLPIIFVVDELDRCRPDFALSLLESIKHLFSVTGITFLLVVNKRQLEESVRTNYGRGLPGPDCLPVM